MEKNKKYDLKTILTILVPLLLGSGTTQAINTFGQTNINSTDYKLEKAIDSLASKRDLHTTQIKIDSLSARMRERFFIDSIMQKQLTEKVDTMLARDARTRASIDKKVRYTETACNNAFEGYVAKK